MANSLLDYKGCSKRLMVSERTVWALVKSGELKAIRIGKRSIRITEEALEEYIRNSAMRSSD